eukprot:6467039-Amphidinium_carterae.1
MGNASKAKHVYVQTAPCVIAISLSMDALVTRVLEGVSLAIPSLLLSRQGCDCKCEPVLTCPAVSSFWLLLSGYTLGLVTGVAVSAVLACGCARQRGALFKSNSSAAPRAVLSEPDRPAGVSEGDPEQAGCWYILTPEGDVYSEDYRPQSEDVMDLKLIEHLGAACVEIGGARCHRFAAPPTDAEFIQLVRSLHARLGLARPQQIELVRDMSVVRRQQARQLLEGGPSERSDLVWVAMETRGGISRGRLVQPSADDVIMEDRAILRSQARCRKEDAPMVAGDDLRMMPLKYDVHGERKRPFAESVSLLNDGVADLDKLISGPRSFVWLAKHARDNGGSFYSNHQVWLRDSGISPSDRSCYEAEALSRSLDAFVTVDQ